MSHLIFRNLSAEEFEELAQALMERMLKTRLFRYAAGPDGGIDICDDLRTHNIIVQCKRYNQGQFQKLYSTLKNEKVKLNNLQPYPRNYYLFTSIELLPRQKKQILELFEDCMDDDSNIVDGIAIDGFFLDKNNYDLISRFDKLFNSYPPDYNQGENLYKRLMDKFLYQFSDHPSIKMMKPDPRLFPKGLPAIKNSERTAVEGSQEPASIKDMILNSWDEPERKHILLVGEGGIGKTVAMLTLPNEEWFCRYKIPVLFIPLQSLDIYEGRLNEYINNNYGDEMNGIRKLSGNKWNNHPNIIVLLDGFNEIPIEYKITAEKHIREWMNKPGVQIITTSRINSFLNNKFLEYTLQLLPYKTSREYLLSAGISEDDIPPLNDNIWKVINVPLMLTMYTKIDIVKERAKDSVIWELLDWKDSYNAAHIVWNYLQVELYRLISADESKGVLSAVAVLVVAPYVCFIMAKNRQFYVEKNRYKEIIHEAVCYFSLKLELLPEQINNISYLLDEDNIGRLFEDSTFTDYFNILSNLSVLFSNNKNTDSSGKYEIVYAPAHQNFRDALAAIYISECMLNGIRKANKKAIIEEISIGADFYVKNYISEFLSDYELVEIWNYHKRNEPENGGVTCFLMDIIGRKRNYDFRQLNFNGLDLLEINLHKLFSVRLDICPLPDNAEYFEKTKISFDNLIPESHILGASSVAFYPDGRSLANGSPDNTVRVWDLESGISRKLEGHKDLVVSVSFSPDGRRLASGSLDNTVRIWDLESGISRVFEGHTGVIYSVSFSPDGRHLVSGSGDKTVRVWDLENGISRVLEGHTDCVNSVSFSPDGRCVASGSSDKTLRVWYLESINSNMLEDQIDCTESASCNTNKVGQVNRLYNKKRLLRELENCISRVYEGHMGKVTSVAFSPDGWRLASGSSDNTVRVWDLKSDIKRVFEGHTDEIYCVSFSPDGIHLASGSGDNTVCMWNLENGTKHVLEGHTNGVHSISFSPDGMRLASGSYDKTIRVWNLESGRSRIMEGRTNWVNSVSFSVDGRHLATGSDDGTVRVWELATGRSRVLEGHTDWVKSVSFSMDGKSLASGSYDGTVRVWDLEIGKSRVLEGRTRWVRSVSFSPDGRYLASGSYEKNVRVWDLKSGKILLLKGHMRGINSVSFSMDGKYLASGSYDNTVRVWSLESGESRIIEALTRGVNCVSFSPDGKLLACGSDDGIVQVWNLKDGDSCVLEGHTNLVYSVSFSADGRHLVSGSYDKTVRVWDLKSGRSHIMKGHNDWVRSVSFSPDGKYIASGSYDGTVLLWNATTREPVKRLRIINRANYSGANFEKAIIPESDRKLLREAGSKA